MEQKEGEEGTPKPNLFEFVCAVQEGYKQVSNTLSRGMCLCDVQGKGVFAYDRSRNQFGIPAITTGRAAVWPDTGASIRAYHQRQR
jgi:hypothetical protein